MKRKRQQGPILGRGDGTISINLQDTEREALAGLLDQLESLLSGDPNDPRVRRLYPAAYHQNPEHEAEYRSFMMPELIASRATAIEKAREALERTEPLETEQALSFMTVLNTLRLVLGTMLDVDEGSDPDLEPSDPGYEQWQLYGYLGWLLEWTVEALADT